MTKKIGIITLQGNNYGATLQATALNYVINEMKYRAENIDYNDPERVYRGLSANQKAKNVMWRNIRFFLGGRKKDKRFEIFRRKNLVLSPQNWRTPADLQKNPPDYDAYISGSDQIWNPDVINNDFCYLLDFVPKNRRKISYASSFGKGRIPERYSEKYRELLSDYQYLSVRESSGARLIQQLTGRTAQVVLDPTLLLNGEQWEKMASPQKENNDYILCYYMPGDKVVTKAIREQAQVISKKTGLHVINLGLKEYYKLVPGMDCRTTAGPAEFLRLFLDAEYIITNSFHGTALAVEFGKRLCVPVNAELDNTKARHTRVLDFLKQINREESIFYVNKDVKNEFHFSSPDTRTEQALEMLRAESFMFLRTAIEGE